MLHRSRVLLTAVMALMVVTMLFTPFLGKQGLSGAPLALADVVQHQAFFDASSGHEDFANHSHDVSHSHLSDHSHDVNKLFFLTAVKNWDGKAEATADDSRHRLPVHPVFTFERPPRPVLS